ncbi:MAG: ABC transporter permease [Polyangiales bacterium]
MRTLAVFERDLRRMLRNPLTLFSAVLMPLLYLVILGNSLQGPIKGLPLGVVALDRGPQARALLGALQALEHGPGTVRVIPMSDEQHALSLLRDGVVSGFVVVPQHFSSDLGRGQSAGIGLYLDNVDAVAAGALQAAISAALPAIRRPLARFELHLGEAKLLPQELYPRVDYDTSLVPAVVVMAIFMGSMIAGGFNLVMDRFLGVHESYLSTPLSRLNIALGVLASGTVVTMVSSSVVLWSGLLLTGGQVHGGITGYLALLAVQLLTTFGLLAMMMAVLGRTSQPRITGVLSGFLNVILFFPSGALYPLASFPRWLRVIAIADPETHAVAALKAILFRNGDLASAGVHVLFLAVFALGMTTIAITTLKRTL